jgi:hypothetical protein
VAEVSHGDHEALNLRLLGNSLELRAKQATWLSHGSAHQLTDFVIAIELIHLVRQTELHTEGVSRHEVPNTEESQRGERDRERRGTKSRSIFVAKESSSL